MNSRLTPIEAELQATMADAEAADVAMAKIWTDKQMEKGDVDKYFALQEEFCLVVLKNDPSLFRAYFNHVKYLAEKYGGLRLKQALIETTRKFLPRKSGGRWRLKSLDKAARVLRPYMDRRGMVKLPRRSEKNKTTLLEIEKKTVIARYGPAAYDIWSIPERKKRFDATKQALNERAKAKRSTKISV